VLDKLYIDRKKVEKQICIEQEAHERKIEKIKAEIAAKDKAIAELDKAIAEREKAIAAHKVSNTTGKA